MLQRHHHQKRPLLAQTAFGPLFFPRFGPDRIWPDLSELWEAGSGRPKPIRSGASTGPKGGGQNLVGARRCGHRKGGPRSVGSPKFRFFSLSRPRCRPFLVSLSLSEGLSRNCGPGSRPASSGGLQAMVLNWDHNSRRKPRENRSVSLSVSLVFRAKSGKTWNGPKVVGPRTVLAKSGVGQKRCRPKAVRAKSGLGQKRPRSHHHRVIVVIKETSK